MDPNELLLTAVRATVVYFFVLFVIRILGKREVGNIVVLHVMVDYATYRSTWFDRLVSSGKVSVVREGRFIPERLRWERISEDMVRSHLRLRGVDNLAMVPR